MEMAIAGLARLRQLYIKRALDAATKATELDPTYAKVQAIYLLNQNT
jgi:hypothetical protein